MNDYIYVDSQTAILLGGQEIDIELEYDESSDQFIVTADCDRWTYDITEFNAQYYPDNDVTAIIDDAKDDCKRISGVYETLREINNTLNKYCESSSYYDFTWEYEDGTPVE